MEARIITDNKCKYLLPCGRCDKYDRNCDMPKENECNNHIWILINSYTNSAGTNKTYKCAKCDAVKLVDGNGSIYESGEWTL